MKRMMAVLGVSAMALTGCTTVAHRDDVGVAPFGRTADGTAVSLYTLRNARGAEARITNYGGIVVSLTMPDRQGRYADVVLGCDTLEGYVKCSPYFGALVGRYCNRIAKGRFTLEGREYTLAINNPPNHLHGGVKGFDKAVWQATPLRTATGPALELRYVSRDGEEGYPGTLTVTARYTLTDQNELRVDFKATTDRTTVCNLTQHSYFNLADGGRTDVLGDEVQINARRFTPIDATSIPTGELRPVAGTPFDFTAPHRIGERIGALDEQIKNGTGYDHNFVLDKAAGALALAARVYDPRSGRVLEVWTTEPGVQFYTGNFLDGGCVGKGGVAYQAHAAFCLEPQHYPDSPNRPEFPPVTLRPGEVYASTSVFRFLTR